ncbi:MAG: SGNH/GDSL hydrolase family protein, partial [Actinobacteria bacterium]|nr:SGNH/GDSL hydrolase family protein [Actinomycetota bacterium]
MKANPIVKGPVRFLISFTKFVAGGFVLLALVIGAEVMLARTRVSRLEEPGAFAGAEFGDQGAPPMHLVVIGDSTAVGVGTHNPNETYPWIIADDLGKKLRVRLDVVARSGARMQDLAEFVPRANAFNPDLVLIGLGGNDVTHLTSMKRVADLLAHAVGALSDADTKVVICLGPPFDSPIFETPLAQIIHWRVNRINETIRKVARSRGVPIIDLPAGLGDRFARDPKRYYSADTFHPG